MATPATSTMACIHHGFEVKEPGSPSPCWRMAKSSWPRMRTKPPKGMAFTLYSIPPFRRANSRGGNPNANSSTRIPSRRAVR